MTLARGGLARYAAAGIGARLAATHTAESEENAALRHLLVRRVRLALGLGIASTLVFAAVNHLAQPAPLAWSDRMNGAVGLALVASLLLTTRPWLERHPTILPVALALLTCAVRAWAGVWQGEATTTAIFLVVVAMTTAAMLPWGVWPQLVTAAAAGAAIAANAALVAGTAAGTAPARAVVAVLLGLTGSVIIAAESRRHHRQLLRDSLRRRRAETDLARLNLELERRVEERTAQLAAATRDLAREADERRLAAAEMRESQRRLQAVLDHADVAIYLRDLEGRYVLVNRFWQQIAGRSAAETIGRRMEEVMPPPVAAALRARDAEILAAPHSLQFEETVPHPDGPRTYVSVKFAWMGESDRPLGIWGVSTDITPLKQAEAELRRSEAALSAVVENTSDAVWSIDRRGRLTVINSTARRRMAELFGASTAAQAGDYAVLRDDFRDLYARALSGEHVQVEHRFEDAAGPRHFLTSLHPIVEAGEVVGATGFSKDITPLKRAELAAREHQAELAHVLRLGTIGEIAAGLAHEINQPLGAIANYAQGCALRLRAGPLDPAVLLDVVERIAGQALRAGEVIRRLRDLVRKDEAAHAPAALNELVRGAARLIDAEARRRGVAVRLELAPALPPIRCDAIQIEQVLLNVLLNGVEATDGVPNAVVVRTAARDGLVEVAVRDAGVGLPPPPVDVFAPFVTTKPEGLGMGLSISRSIVEAHGGALWAVANPDRGTTFHLTLPADAVAQPERTLP